MSKYKIFKVVKYDDVFDKHFVRRVLANSEANAIEITKSFGEKIVSVSVEAEFEED